MKQGWLVWAVALSAYFLAVFHRSSLAVAGLVAADRFDISAAQLATFTVLQLLVYAGMQVPVGVLVDRFGPRRVILTGSITLVVAQVAFAYSTSFSAALIARTAVGLGDAMTMVCLLRLINAWFAPRQVPLITQISGPIGQGGAIVAAIPMTWALHTLHWTTTYLIAASASIVVCIAIFVFVRDSPLHKVVSGRSLSVASVRASLTSAWSHPGTRLGFWTHFSTQFSSTVLGLLWGYPYFVRAQHTSSVEAGALLTIMVIAILVAGPLLGWFVGNHAWHRSTLVLALVWSQVVIWAIVLAWPGAAPMWLLVLLVVIVGVGGPASMIGFDYARTSNPLARLGVANGIVNQAGFVASLTLALVIGVILDVATPPGQSYAPEAFTLAMSSQFILWALGLSQIWRYRRRLRAMLLAAAA